MQLGRHDGGGAGLSCHDGQQAAAGADVQAVRLAVFFLLALHGPRNRPLVRLVRRSDTRQPEKPIGIHIRALFKELPDDSWVARLAEAHEYVLPPCDSLSLCHKMLCARLTC